jgi:hypothetical protein
VTRRVTALDRMSATLRRTDSWRSWLIDEASHAELVAELTALRHQQGLFVVQQPDGAVWVMGRRIGIWKPQDA